MSDHRSGQGPSTHEALRLAALRRYRVLDTPAEDYFDDIARIAAEICGTPMALISLVDDSRQWFKAAVGLAATQTPREIAFCAHAIEQREVFLVEDAALDPRFANNPLVTGDPHLRFYAGSALQTPDGYAIGTLCVLDRKPHTLTATQQRALEALGRQVVTQLELRHTLSQQATQETRNQLILDSAIDYAIVSIDLKSRVTSWNEGARRIFGWTASEMCGRLCDDFFVPEDRAAGIPEREMSAALARGRGSDERWHLRKNGSRFYASGEMMPLKDAADAPIGFIKIIRDRTTHRRAELINPALLELADRIQELADPLESAAIAAEILGRTLQVDGATYATFKEDDRSVKVERHWSVTSAADIPRFAIENMGAHLQSLRAGRVVVVNDVLTDSVDTAAMQGEQAVRAFVEYPLLEKGRLVALFRVTCATVREWDAQEIAFIREVAERTRLAVERRKAEFHYRELAASLETEVESRLNERNRLWASTNDLMATVGADGFLKEVNPAWTRLLGWDQKTLLQLPLLEIIDPVDRARARQAAEQLTQGHQIVDRTDTLKAKDGRSHVVTWSAVPDGPVYHIVGRDITRQREIEERLRQSHKMDAIGQLTGGIAHDFNNLLAGILGSLALIRVRNQRGQHTVIEPLIEAAERSARNAASMTQRLLAFSRRQSLDTKSQDVNRLILGMEDLLHRTLGPHIQLQTELGSSALPAMTDANQLENAILNLAINARDAMPNGGRLTIETVCTCLDSASAASNAEVVPGEYVAIAVSDTGKGMSPEVLAKAFDPFFTTKPIGEGTGLGLSMIYGFAKQSNGHVRIYSEEGRGTTVKIYLPRALEAEEDATPATMIEAPRGSGELVLVVEDDETVRMLVVEVLRELGYAYHEAADAQMAMKVLDSSAQVDLLLTDVGLPGMNGRQLVEVARQRRPKLKVLFLTGYAEQAAVRGGFLGADMEMLTKPFALDVLATKVRDMLAANG